MAYELLKPQPGARDASLAWEDLGPGLYGDETALKLDDGTLVAVSVEPKWLENGGGVVFTGWCRWIDADGQTHLCGHGQQVETAFTHNADAAQIQEHGVQFIAKEMIHLLLGEALTTVEVTNEGGKLVDHPVTNWNGDIVLNASIRHAIKSVEATGPNSIDAANILGL